MRRILFIALLMALASGGCERERKPLETSARATVKPVETRAAEHRAAVFERYDAWLRRQIAEFPGRNLTPGSLGSSLPEARAAVVAALGIEAAAPAAAATKVWAKRLPHARLEAWRVSGPEGAADMPVLLWLPPDSRPRAVVVLANGTGQNKHDFLSQLACSAYVSAGAACLAWDGIGEGERSHEPLSRAREFLNNDSIAMSTDIGKPLLGIHVNDIRRVIGAAKKDERLAAVPLALAGYSLGGWTGLLTGLADERVDVLVAASTMVVPSEISGLSSGGWRVPGLARAIRLHELLALNAHAHPTLWINGGADASFVTDDSRRLSLLGETARAARALLGGRAARLTDAVVPQGPHLPYFITVPALEFLARQGALPQLEQSGLLKRPAEALTMRLADVAKTTELKWWPRSMMEAPYAPRGLPIVSSKELLLGGKFPKLDEWIFSRVSGAQESAKLPPDAGDRGRLVRRLLDPALDSLVDPARWKKSGESEWEDSHFGLQARIEIGSGEGLAVYYPKNRTILGEAVPADLQERAARILVTEPLSYSDNEVAAETTATGRTLAALLSLLANPALAAPESYEIMDGTGTLAVPLALIDPRVSSVELTARQLTTIAPTQFQFEGHVPGLTTVFAFEDLLGALAPLPLRIAEGALLEHEREALIARYQQNPESLTFIP